MKGCFCWANSVRSKLIVSARKITCREIILQSINQPVVRSFHQSINWSSVKILINEHFTKIFSDSICFIPTKHLILRLLFLLIGFVCSFVLMFFQFSYSCSKSKKKNLLDGRTVAGVKSYKNELRPRWRICGQLLLLLPLLLLVRDELVGEMEATAQKEKWTDILRLRFANTRRQRGRGRQIQRRRHGSN